MPKFILLVTVLKIKQSINCSKNNIGESGVHALEGWRPCALKSGVGTPGWRPCTGRCRLAPKSDTGGSNSGVDDSNNGTSASNGGAGASRRRRRVDK